MGIHPRQDTAPYSFNSSTHISHSVLTCLLFAERSWAQITVPSEKVRGLDDQKLGLQRCIELSCTLQTLGVLN